MNQTYKIVKLTNGEDIICQLKKSMVSEDYRVINAVEAIKILKKENYDLKLIIAGNLRKQLIDKINNENLNYVKYVGGYNCSTANKIFNSASIYLHLHYMGCCDNILLEMMYQLLKQKQVLLPITKLIKFS